MPSCSSVTSGDACGSNPLPIFIPCHRVVAADGSLRPEPRMEMTAVTDTFLAMARLPLSANVLFMTVMATGMPFVGRG